MNNNYTIGVEEEYMLCDPNRGELVDKANIVMSNIPLDLKDRFSYELLLSVVESNTKICDNVTQSIEELNKNRNFLLKIGKKNDFKIGISGTHPTALPEKQNFVKSESYNWVSSQLQYYAKRNITFSTHIHIGLYDSENIIKVTNSLRRWIAPLLALSANSPFFEGIKTGMHSSRTFQFSSFPRTNIPAYIEDLSAFNKIIDLHKKANSISKDRQIWWKIRPHIEYGTVEFRVCDIQLSLERTEMLVALVQALVRTIIKNEDFMNSDYNYELLQDGLWKSSKFGINSLIIDPQDEKIISMKAMIKKMLNYSNNSLKYFNTEHIISYVNEVLENGSESTKQLELYDEYGFTGLKSYLTDSGNW